MEIENEAVLCLFLLFWEKHCQSSPLQALVFPNKGCVSRSTSSRCAMTHKITQTESALLALCFFFRTQKFPTLSVWHCLYKLEPNKKLNLLTWLIWNMIAFSFITPYWKKVWKTSASIISFQKNPVTFGREATSSIWYISSPNRYLKKT